MLGQEASNCVSSEFLYSEELVELKGVLKRIVYTNPENGYSICQLDLGRRQGLVTLIGYFPGVQCGETLKVRGRWTEHEKFGKQLKAESFQSTLPVDIHGIRQYLSSGLVHGIGKEYANKIVEFFGTETFNVLNEASARLLEVPGIGKKRAKQIKEAWDEQQAVRDTMIFLQAYGISNTQCLRLYQYYGQDTKKVITQNPYVIVKTIEGIGFKSADKIALNLGLTVDSEFRIDAALEYVLSEAEADGNTGARQENLVQKTAELLDIAAPLIATRLQKLLEDNVLSEYPASRLIQRSRMSIHEACVAKHIQRLFNTPSCLPLIQADQALAWAEQKLEIRWSETQKKALKAILQSKLSVLTGGPGTGKTTLLKALVGVLQTKHIRLCLAAPTGRAAQRMGEATGVKARTVHRTLKFEPSIGRFTYDDANPLPIDFLILDESSMLDVPLTHALLRAIPDKAHVLLVGDIYQLPSVGPGNVLNDFINSPYFHVESLNEIFRQGQKSSIVSTAHNILQGKRTLESPVVLPHGSINWTEDFHFIGIENPDQCLDVLKFFCWDRLPKQYGVDPIRDIQILAPMHRGGMGIEQINLAFQEQMGLQRRKVEVGSQAFFIGDKVIQLKNNYDKNIFNGDLGIIQGVDGENKELIVNFNDEEHVLERRDCLDLKLAYAISIHKSQGSEFPIVLIPLFTQHFVMLKRNLLYTAITRGRKKVFIFGDPRAYSIAVRTLDSTIRQTTLKERLLHLFKEQGDVLQEPTRL